MQAMNCPRCGRVFTKIRSPVCPACEKEEEESFDAIKQYINDNPGCTLAELAEATGSSARRITQYIREGRLEISKGMSGEIKCDKCGKPITRGRYCDSCAIQVQRDVLTMFSNPDGKVALKLFLDSSLGRVPAAIGEIRKARPFAGRAFLYSRATDSAQSFRAGRPHPSSGDVARASHSFS